MQPSMEEWRALYEAAIAFREAAPWDWMWEGDLFGVQDPESGEIGYCSVMGELGEHFSLAVYLGSEGLEALWQLRQQEPGEMDPAEILSAQHCLMGSYEDRGQLEKRDLDLIKALGLKFRGRNAWPMFRSYRPGYVPWFLTAPEARFLTLCLRLGLEVSRRAQEDEELIPEPQPHGAYLVLVPEKRGDAWEWKDTFQRPAPVQRPAAALPPLDEARVERLRRLPASNGVVQMDHFTMNTIITGEGGERPYIPQLVLAADAASGLILGSEIAAPGEVPAMVIKQLLGTVETMRQRPARIEVQREAVLEFLKPVAERLGIRLVRARRLRAVEAARRELASFLGAGIG